MPMRTGTPLPELSGATEWINSPAIRADLVGSPLLVHFWAISCHVCHDNMPTVAAWREQYAANGLKVVAVHMPRQPEDTDVERVRGDAASMGITEPLAVDNSHVVADAFQNEFVPAYFLFDAEGNLRSRAAGYTGLSMLEGALKRVLGVA
ncbi:MAG: TlpA disulfide reductase family protein [Armatimonadetes bacterium]|nr:TlpA disulfide reductase family protein [Armatimonadota bacterium]